MNLRKLYDIKYHDNISNISGSNSYSRISINYSPFDSESMRIHFSFFINTKKQYVAVLSAIFYTTLDTKKIDKELPNKILQSVEEEPSLERDVITAILSWDGI